MKYVVLNYNAMMFAYMAILPYMYGNVVAQF